VELKINVSGIWSTNKQHSIYETDVRREKSVVGGNERPEPRLNVTNNVEELFPSPVNALRNHVFVQQIANGGHFEH